MANLKRLHTAYDSICITFLKSQNDRNGEDINGCPELGMLGEKMVVITQKEHVGSLW